MTAPASGRPRDAELPDDMLHVKALADDCAADGTYELLFTSAPLAIPGGIGSPPNALAIK